MDFLFTRYHFFYKFFNLTNFFIKYLYEIIRGTCEHLIIDFKSIIKNIIFFINFLIKLNFFIQYLHEIMHGTCVHLLIDFK